MAKFFTFSTAIIFSVLFFAVAESSAQQAQSSQITWLKDAREAIRIAREEKRPLLIYVESDDCFYCRKMEKRTWQNAAIATTVTKKFVPLKLSAEVNAKEVRQLKVEAFPTTILLTSQIKIHDSAVGMLSPNELTEMLARGPANVALQPVARQ